MPASPFGKRDQIMHFRVGRGEAEGNRRSHGLVDDLQFAVANREPVNDQAGQRSGVVVTGQEVRDTELAVRKNVQLGDRLIHLKVVEPPCPLEDSGRRELEMETIEREQRPAVTVADLQAGQSLLQGKGIEPGLPERDFAVECGASVLLDRPSCQPWHEQEPGEHVEDQRHARDGEEAQQSAAARAFKVTCHGGSPGAASVAGRS